MITSEYATGIEGRRAYDRYIAESNNYRMIFSERQKRSRARQMLDARRYRIVERIGAGLIAVGRALCERRGAVAVEVAFHPGPGGGHHRPHGRHVA
jgi:hypothetical protein